MKKIAGYTLILFFCILCLPTLIVSLGAESASWVWNADSFVATADTTPDGLGVTAGVSPGSTVTPDSSTAIPTPSTVPTVSVPVSNTIRVYNTTTNKPFETTLEDYIVEVVLAEMPAYFELEALKAQAVAARTYTYKRMLEGENADHPDCVVCTDSAHCQAWRALSAVTPSTPKPDGTGAMTAAEKIAKVQQAVSETAGMIACYDGKPIEALYHSCSGGMTENVENVWQGSPVPYLISVESPGEEVAGESYKDSIAMTKEAFITKLKAAKADVDATVENVFTGMGQIKRNASGRIISMQIGGVIFTGRELREIFDLRSTHIRFSEDGEKITLITYGYGHGVGMSQHGANARALEGKGYEEILKYYYTGITVKKISG